MYKNEYHYNDSPAADGQTKRTLSADIITIGLTKERRRKDVKNDVENGVDEGKKLCPIYGTMSHLWYIKNNTIRVLDREQCRRRSPTI